VHSNETPQSRPNDTKQGCSWLYFDGSVTCITYVSCHIAGISRIFNEFSWKIGFLATGYVLFMLRSFNLWDKTDMSTTGGACAAKIRHSKIVRQNTAQKNAQHHPSTYNFPIQIQWVNGVLLVSWQSVHQMGPRPSNPCQRHSTSKDAATF
jgi:hypothetical protein